MHIGGGNRVGNKGLFGLEGEVRTAWYRLVPPEITPTLRIHRRMAVPVRGIMRQQQQGSQVQVDDRSGTAIAHPDPNKTLKDSGTSARQRETAAV